MSVPTIAAGWPPSPGLDKEEPRLWLEDDIPQDDTGAEPDEGVPGAAGAQASARTGEPARERPGGGEAAPGEANAQRTP